MIVPAGTTIHIDVNRYYQAPNGEEFFPNENYIPVLGTFVANQSKVYEFVVYLWPA